MGLFNLMCYQLETTGAIEEAVRTQYELTAKGLSKNLVAGFDQEIDKYREVMEADRTNQS